MKIFCFKNFLPLTAFSKVHNSHIRLSLINNFRTFPALELAGALKNRIGVWVGCCCCCCSLPWAKGRSLRMGGRDEKAFWKWKDSIESADQALWKCIFLMPHNSSSLNFNLFWPESCQPPSAVRPDWADVPCGRCRSLSQGHWQFEAEMRHFKMASCIYRRKGG